MYEMITINVDGSDMATMITRPEGDGPHPGLQIAMHLPGHIGLETGGGYALGASGQSFQRKPTSH